MAKATKTTKTKVIKKRWIAIQAPKIFNSQVIGETYVADIQTVMGKTISVSLANIAGDMKRQNIYITFKVNDISGEKASTEIIGYSLSTSSVKRMVRRSKKKIDQSIAVETSDDKKIRLKLVLLTRGMTNRSVLSAVRKLSEETLLKEVKSKTYDALVEDIVNHKTQMILKKTLSKIYPLQICEIRSMSIIKSSGNFAAVKPKKKKVKEEKHEEEVEEKPAEAEAPEEKIE